MGEVPLQDLGFTASHPNLPISGFRKDLCLGADDDEPTSFIPAPQFCKESIGRIFCTEAGVINPGKLNPDMVPGQPSALRPNP